MLTDFGILENDIDINGNKFKKDTILRVWNAGNVTSIQPFFLDDDLFVPMWYLIKDEHESSIKKLCASLFDGIDPKYLPNVFS